MFEIVTAVALWCAVPTDGRIGDKQHVAQCKEQLLRCLLDAYGRTEQSKCFLDHIP